MRNTPITAAKGSRLEAQASFSLHCLSPLDARKENMTAIYEKGRAKMNSILHSHCANMKASLSTLESWIERDHVRQKLLDSCEPAAPPPSSRTSQVFVLS